MKKIKEFFQSPLPNRKDQAISHESDYSRSLNSFELNLLSPERMFKVVKSQEQELLRLKCQNSSRNNLINDLKQELIETTDKLQFISKSNDLLSRELLKLNDKLECQKSLLGETMRSQVQIKSELDSKSTLLLKYKTSFQKLKLFDTEYIEDLLDSSEGQEVQIPSNIMEKNINRLSERVVELTHENNKNYLKIKHLEEEFDNLVCERDIFHEENSQLKLCMQNAHTEIQGLKHQEIELKSKVNRKKAKIDSLRSKLINLREQSRETTKENQQQILDLELQVSNLKTDSERENDKDLRSMVNCLKVKNQQLIQKVIQLKLKQDSVRVEESQRPMTPSHREQFATISLIKSKIHIIHKTLLVEIEKNPHGFSLTDSQFSVLKQELNSLVSLAKLESFVTNNFSEGYRKDYSDSSFSFESPQKLSSFS